MLPKLHPIRLLDGHTSGGVQLFLPWQKEGSRLLSVLPALLAQTRVWQEAFVPGGMIEVELAAASRPQSVDQPVVCNLLFRVRMPETASVADVDTVCGILGQNAVEWLAAHGVRCDTVLSDDGESVLPLYPREESAHLRCVTKERRVYREQLDVQFYFSPLRPLASLRAADWDRMIQKNVGRGISLHLLPGLADSAERAGLEQTGLRFARPDTDYSRTLSLLHNEEQTCTAMLTFWSGSEQDLDAFSFEILRTLNASGAFLTVRKVQADACDCLLYDPWALYERYRKALGVKLAYMAFTLTGEETASLFQNGTQTGDAPENQAPPAVPKPPEQTDERLKEAIEKIGDALLEQLRKKMDQALPAADFHATAGEMLARLDQLAAQSQRISGQVDQVDSIIHAQEEVYLRRLNETEANIKESLEDSTRQVLAALGENLSQVLARIAELPDTADVARAAMEQMENALPRTMPLALTAEEMQALGAASEEDLARKGMTPEEIRLLKIALSLARMGLQQEGEENEYMPFAAPLGFLYEMMVHNSFDPRLTDCDRANRAEEFKPKQDRPGQEERWAAANNAELKLSFYDYVSRYRVFDGYFKHVYIDGKPLADPMEWNIWFSCFKCVRAVRNKVHANRGHVERTELENLYRLMLRPGTDSKWTAIRYQIDHSDLNVKNSNDSSVLIRHYQKQRDPAEMITYLNGCGGRNMCESLIQFLLRIRSSAVWNE